MKIALAILLAASTVAFAQTKPAPAPQTYSVGDYRLVLNNVVVSSDVHIDNNVPSAVYINSQTGRVVKLSDEDYALLQKLRQAVVDEEKKIAIAHGVDTEGDMYPCGKDATYGTMCAVIPEWKPRFPDRYQFRGQWLFINIPKAAQMEAK